MSIMLFIFTYLLMFALSVGLTVLCAWMAWKLFSFSISTLTILMAIGLLCMGGMITYFLLKFIFAKHKADRFHLVEITAAEEPALFALVATIVEEAGTDFPKRIYLSADVNAAVFYDSSFWSMFFPVRKNLQIGVGLVNSVTRLELKAILAHEFGHFSQRSMKLGSYVYNVNQVIYNMLYDNESYKEQVSAIAGASGVIALFVLIALRAVQGIQLLLQQIYKLINLTYLGLSREMEFHADQIAAQVAGTTPMVSSLLRMNLADQALRNVLGFYSQRYQQSITTGNIYTQQQWMLTYLSASTGAKVVAGLPMLTADHLERYSQSKLVIKNQWASHPSEKDRINALRAVNVSKAEDDGQPGNSIFQDAGKWQEAFTTRIFGSMEYPGPVMQEDLATFKQAYGQQNPLFIFPAVFNGYYDQWNPSPAPSPAAVTAMEVKTPATLFSDDLVNLALSLNSLESDKALLHQLMVQEHDIKTFDYDGVRYSMDNVYELIARLDADMLQHRATLKANDDAVYAWLYHQAAGRGAGEELAQRYETYSHVERQLESRRANFDACVDAVKFMSERMAFAQIKLNLVSLAEPERNFKAQLAAMLEEEAYQQVLQPEQLELIKNYLQVEQVYFSDDKYDNAVVELLHDVLRGYLGLLERGAQSAKLSLLEFCAELAGKVVPALM